MVRPYKICKKCIMDTTDPDIWFDDDGICSHCHRYKSIIQSKSYLKKREDGALERLVAEIKKKANKKYDCIIGVSGGVDSTYVAYIVKKLGLQPLAVHLDNGWNSDIAVSNMKNTLEKLEIELYNYDADCEEFYDLQLAFLKASTPDVEIPTDHALRAALYEVAARENIQFIISGHNTATEGGGVAAWSQGHGDWRYIKSVYKKFGSRSSLKSFPHYGPFRFIYYTLIKKIRWIQILDYLYYNKKQAMTILENELGWKYYGGKHYESIYTRFCQGYILPKKFGFDKRRLHLSSLVWSCQISRDDALEEMTKSDYPAELQEQDRKLVEKKLGISHEKFDKIMNYPVRSFWDYPSYKKIFKNKLFLSIYHAQKHR